MVEGKPDVDKVALIRAVRQFEVLYNSDADGYANKSEKDLVWDKVVLTIWPKYKFCGSKLKENMRNNVKRRWKTLRNLVAKEVKKAVTNQNYVRKENILLDEMEFLVPHIKTYGLGQSRNSHSFSHEASINDATEDDDMDDCVDLTDDCDTKPYVKMESDIHDVEYDFGMYPIAELGSGGGDDNSRLTTNTSYDDHRGYDDYDTNSNSVHQNFCDSTNEAVQSADSPSAKRSRIENSDVGHEAENNAAFQKKVIQLISNIESRRDKPEPEKPKEDAPDEDRMFLLSLVSDLRRVPASKKMLVKAEIATVIARAMS